jgi:hypothetical protein
MWSIVSTKWNTKSETKISEPIANHFQIVVKNLKRYKSQGNGKILTGLTRCITVRSDTHKSNYSNWNADELSLMWLELITVHNYVKLTTAIIKTRCMQLRTKRYKILFRKLYPCV